MIREPGGHARRASRSLAGRIGMAVLISCAAALAGAARAAAQTNTVDQYLGKIVADIRMVSAGTDVTDPRLRPVLDVRVGRPLTVASIRESVVHLMGLGRFQDVRVDASSVPNGVRVVFDLLPLRDVKRVVFRGDLGLPELTLRSAVEDRFGPTPAIGRAADIAAALEELLHDRGFLRAKVTPVAAADESSESGDLGVDIAAGPPARIQAIVLDGTDPGLNASLLQRLQLHTGDRYDPAALQTRITQYLDEWHNARYYEAHLDRVAKVNDAKDAVSLTVTLERGPLVTVEFQGDPLGARERAELVPISREGTVDEDLLEDSERRIADYLHAQGYRDAEARFVRTEAPGTLRIVFTVRRGPLFKVAAVQLPSVASLSQEDLRTLFRIAPGQAFVQARVDQGVAAVASEYHRRGYAAAKVTESKSVVSSPGLPAGQRLIVVALAIVEGPRTVFGAVTIKGNAAVPAARLEALIETRPGHPFDPGSVEADKAQLLVEYLNRGYRMAEVDAETAESDDRTRADVTFTIREGPEVFVDQILVVGNQRISESTIRHELVIEAGQPLSLAKLNDSQQRLVALGLFRRVTIAELQHRGETRRDILVTVEESPSTTIGFGGGVEFQTVETSEFAPRGFFELGRRNLWGKNRSINLYSRVSFRSRSSISSSASSGQAGSTTSVPHLFTEYRVVGSYREPRFLMTRADLQGSVLFEQGSRTSFSFRRRSVRLELARRFSRIYSVAGQYALERNDLLEERLNPVDKPLIDRLFPSVRLSTFSITAVRDTRDDQIDPGAGSLVGVNGDLALVPLGSQIGFAKTFLQVYTYRRLPLERRVVFAAGARLGLATGFPRTVPAPDAEGGANLPTVAYVTVRDLPANERFFAGGDTTVRGFQLDHLGTPTTFDRDGQPKGGHALAVFNAELRVSIWRDVGVVSFLDVGNVFSKVTDLGLGHFRAGTGFGIRYKSPIGPLRLDVGFKLGSLLSFASTRESRTALHLSIGQAF